MYVYEVKFLGGSTLKVRANSPKDAWKSASEQFPELEVIRVESPKHRYFPRNKQ